MLYHVSLNLNLSICVFCLTCVFSTCVAVPELTLRVCVCVKPGPQLLYPGAECVRINS